MKNLEKYLVYVLLGAVFILFFLQFRNRSGNQSASNELISANTEKTGASKAGRIYYVNTDTVWDKYEYVQEITNLLNVKKKQYEERMERELRTFERDVNEFREKGMSMTEMEVQIKQKDLMRREGELSQLKEELETKFLEEEKEWNDKLRADIISFIEEKNQNRSYDYILGYSVSSNIILANDSLNITDEIVEGINAKYAEKNKTE